MGCAAKRPGHGVDGATVTRRTKIVATIGPACAAPDAMEAMLRAGVDVCRLNLSHGPIDGHLARLETIRVLARRLGRPIGVLADLPGPKLRAGAFPDGGVDLQPGSTVTLVPGSGASDEHRVTVDYPTLLEDVDPGDRVVLGDGTISLEVVGKTTHELSTEVVSGSRVQGRPGVHLSCQRQGATVPTAADVVLAERIAAAGVDYIALSLPRRATDVLALREIVRDRARILVKIETAAAIAELGSITDCADAIMVARGDLGIDCPLEDVPHLQKHIIRHCVEIGTPVVTATQMLESMIHAPSPTRAEVSDVANAVFDGTDAIMLSGETAIGDDPALVVTTMSRIAERAEAEASYRQWASRLGNLQRRRSTASRERITESITHAAWQAADDLEAAAIVCCTRSGRTALAMARFRPACRLVAVSPDPRTVSALTLTWGVEALPMEESDSTDDMVWFAVERVVANRVVGSGDTVVVIAGAPDRRSGAAADVMRIVRVR
jgi:pyruvate kinase